MLLPLPSQETAWSADAAQRLRHNFGKDRCRPTGSSPNLPTEFASQPSTSSNGMQAGFCQSPRAQAAASAGEDRHLSDPGNEVHHQRPDTGLPRLLRHPPRPPRITPWRRATPLGERRHSMYIKELPRSTSHPWRSSSSKYNCRAGGGRRFITSMWRLFVARTLSP